MTGTGYTDYFTVLFSLFAEYFVCKKKAKIKIDRTPCVPDTVLCYLQQAQLFRKRD
jgi:hypothetical protein